MTSAMARLSRKSEDGRRVVEVRLPRRVLRELKAGRVDSLRVLFSNGESFQVDADLLGTAIKETYEKRGRTSC